MRRTTFQVVCVSMELACDPLGSARLDTARGIPMEQEALVVSPNLLDFGTISVLEDGTTSASFWITNAGDQTIAVHGHDEIISLEGDAASVFSVASDPIYELRPGDTREQWVSFVPSSEGSWTAEIRVNYGIEMLRLEAAATAPSIELSLPVQEATPVGCEQSIEVRVRNTGSETLHIDAAELISGTDYFLDGSETFPLTIEGGEEDGLPLLFEPGWTSSADDVRSDTLWVDSNDPLYPQASAELENVAYWGNGSEEGFVFAPGIETDLLFVVNTDGVMGIYADQAASQLGTFVDTLQSANVDLHLAVVNQGSSCPITSRNYAVSADGGATILDLLEEGFGGPSGMGTNALGEHAIEALENSDGGCLDGFLRPNAQLHIVLVTGAPDSSSRSPNEQVEAIRTLAGDAMEVRISALVPVTSEACSGVSLGAGYLDMAAETGGAIEDLCLEDWSGPFTAFSEISIAAQEGELLHVLDNDPIVESIEVTAGGIEVLDWTWEAEIGALRFAEKGTILPGEWVDIRYAEAIPCSEDAE